MSVRVAVYFRCSTDRQDKSMSDQRTVIEQYASEHDSEIVAWFDGDEGKSGTSFENRPDFMRMVKLVESGQHGFAQILVYDVDRWGRPTDPNESTYWEFHFKRFGVQVLYISDNSVNDNSLAGRLSKHIKQELASEESHKQSKRVRERSQARASEGYRVGGFAPYGFKRLLIDPDGTPIKVLEHGERKYEKHQRVVLTPGDPEEIRTVQRIFKLRASGKGPRHIANLLNKEGIPAPSARRPYGKRVVGKWSISTVAAILSNRVHTGTYTYNRQVRGSWAKLEGGPSSVRAQENWVVCEKAHEPIVSQALFERVQAKSALRKGSGLSGRGKGSNYVLSGLIVCSQCGYNYHGHSKNNGYGKKYQYYECSGYALHGTDVCRQMTVRADILEDFIVKKLDERVPAMIDSDRLRSLIREKLDARMQRSTSEAGGLRARLKEVERGLENLARAIEAGGQLDALLNRMSALRGERKGLLEALEAATAGSLAPAEIDALAEQISGLSSKAFSLLSNQRPQEAKLGIRQFVDRVEIDPKTKTASFFVYKLPAIARSSSDFVSVNLCRRPESNRHGIATGGF